MFVLADDVEKKVKGHDSIDIFPFRAIFCQFIHMSFSRTPQESLLGPFNPIKLPQRVLLTFMWEEEEEALDVT